MAQSNAERQRTHKERLKQKAAEGIALAELTVKSQHTFGELITRLERVVLHTEGGATEHARPAGTLSLSPAQVEQLARIKQIRCFREDGHIEPEFHDFRFLGMSAQEWQSTQDELLSVFGLVEVAAEWRRQTNASIAIDQARQFEDREESALAEEANPESEISNGPSQAQEDISSAVAHSGFVKKPKVDWLTLDRVHREWCDEQYPDAPLSWADRYKPDREDWFNFDGALWVRRVMHETLADGSSRIRADFRSNDKRKVFYPYEQSQEPEGQ